MHHTVGRVGSCLVVVAGGYRNGCLLSVQVLDTLNSVVWKLPNLREGTEEDRRFGSSVVTLSRGVTTLSVGSVYPLGIHGEQCLLLGTRTVGYWLVCCWPADENNQRHGIIRDTERLESVMM